MKKARLILGGGSAYGLAHMGVIAAITEQFEISGIVGTSMGAIIGACAAYGIEAPQMLEMAEEISTIELFNPLNLDFTRSGIFDGKAIHKLFAHWTNKARIEDCDIPFIAVAFDLYRQCSILIDKGQLADAMRASSSLPYIFAPHEIGDYLLVDGGVAHPLPLAFAEKVPGELTIAVNVLAPIKQRVESINQSRMGKKEKLSRHDVFVQTLMLNQGLIAVQAATEFKPDIYIDAHLPELSFYDLRKAKDFYEHGYRVGRKSISAYPEPDFGDKLKDTYSQLRKLLGQTWK
ncbi:MAG: patatin-like phospholipase family protein [Candidatus Cloacimonetes bacterium]|nr:patatin-like phospholipase family protein [Candidatus Cloacimonadota bacterium]